MNDKNNNANRIISNILKYGSLISIFFMGLGLIIFMLSSKNVPDIRTIRNISLKEAGRGLFNLEPIAFMTIGLVMLLLTPILRVVTAIFTFLFIENDKKYAFISFGVLIILIISMFIPGIR